MSRASQLLVKLTEQTGLPRSRHHSIDLGGKEYWVTLRDSGNHQVSHHYFPTRGSRPYVQAHGIYRTIKPTSPIYAKAVQAAIKKGHEHDAMPGYTLR